MEQWRESSRSDLLYFICLPVFLLSSFWCKMSWLCACYFLTYGCWLWQWWCFLPGVFLCLGGNGCLKRNKCDNHGVSCWMLLSGPRDDLFCFLCFWEQGGFPIHIHNHTLIGLFFWMAKVAVHTNTPAPYCGYYVHSLAPTVPGYHATQQVSRPVVETLALYLCCPTF